jgi:hypothetical protein
VTSELISALRAHRMADTVVARRAPGHLPVAIELVPSAVRL